MKSIAFHTLGCKLNFAESSYLAGCFVLRGYKQVEFRQKADVYVINTCTVTQVAEKKCRNAIRQAHKLNPMAVIAVIGCMSQLNDKEIETIEGVDLILGNDDKPKLVDLIENYQKKPTVENHVCDISRLKTFFPSYSSSDRTRSFLKIQDGCDYFCTYCAIPYSRGRSRSGSIADVVSCAEVLASEGKKEIVLTGVNIGDFGKQSGETFLQLIEALDKVKGIERYRISSIEPNLITDEVIDFCAASESFLPHFHIPLQAGNNKILHLMKRKYDRELFAQRVERILCKMPDAFVAADVIAGFPGESGEDFEDAKSFIQSLPLAALHVFTYSERPNTPACSMPNSVPVEERHLRSNELQAISDQKKDLFYQKNKGSIRSVLWEADNEEGMMFGFSENYLRVGRKFDSSLINTITREKLETIDNKYKSYIL